MYKKVLVPLDGSKLAECALSHVKNLVKEGSVGEVTILSVFKVELGHTGEAQAALALNINEIRAQRLAAAKKYLADVESRLGTEGVKVKTVALEGNRPAEVISNYAQKEGLDMIVIATHGYTGMKKLMFGSVTLEVLHESHIPILLIRPEACRA
jgi:nucleotide-binding universal stress UspA family protein